MDSTASVRHILKKSLPMAIVDHPMRSVASFCFGVRDFVNGFARFSRITRLCQCNLCLCSGIRHARRVSRCNADHDYERIGVTSSDSVIRNHRTSVSLIGSYHPNVTPMMCRLA